MIDGENLHRLKVFIEQCGGVESAANQLDVRPSTVRKIVAGQSVSPPTGAKFDAVLGRRRALWPSRSQRLFENLSSKIGQMINNPIDVIKVSTRFAVNPSTIQKIIDGRPVSRAVQEKLFSAMETEPSKPTDAKLSMVERLQEIHRLYNDLGTLAAVGQKIGVTRERVRQLLEKGTKLGLFEYKPFNYPFVSKETILADYKEHLSLGHVARINHITPGYLRKLLTAYGVTEEKLRSLLIEGHKARCVKQYHSIQRQLGHHPTTTELQSSKSWRYLSLKIPKLWGSIDSFRD